LCIFDDADGLDGFFLLGNAKFGFDAAAGDVGELTCSFFFFFGGAFLSFFFGFIC